MEQINHYQEKGFSIIPVGKNKKPLIKWEEFQKRRPSVHEIEQWLRDYPDTNIAIVTGKISGIVVLDFDTPEALEMAKAKGLPDTPMVKTARGYHAYFKYQDGVRNFQKRADLPGIDLRGDGGYVIAPPSTHESGVVYSWVSNKSIDHLELAELPEWVLANNESEKTPLNVLEKGVPQGQRNNALTRLAGSWLKNMNFDDCLKKALLWNQKNKPPLSAQEVEATVRSIYKIDEKNSSVEDKELDVEETSFIVLQDGRLAEMIFDKKTGKASFAVFDKGQVTEVQSLIEQGKEIIPYQNEPLITTGIPSVWMPSAAVEYGSDKELYEEIKAFIHKYVVLDERFETLAALYVMFSWVFDCYTVLPYIRVLGDFGTGKSRFLYTVGLVCYKPMVVVAAIGEAPIFRIIERFRGTLVLDEANFKNSDINTAIIQILNAGFEKKAPVLRCTGANFGVEGYQVFCPKIISSRERWKDTALESRCITWLSSASDKVALYLDDTFNQQALELRNKLLMFRFRNYGKKKIDESKLKCYVEPRIKQILLPLTNMTNDQEILDEINKLAKSMNKEIIEDRTARMEARILQAIKDIEDASINKGEKIYLKKIADKYNEQIPNTEKHITAQTVSNSCRKPELMIDVLPKDKNGRSIICKVDQMETLYKKYGIIE